MTDTNFKRIPVIAFYVLIGLFVLSGFLGLNNRPLLAWIVQYGILAAFLVMTGYNIKEVPLGAFIDSRNRVSLSNFQMLMWTLLIVSSYFSVLTYNASFYQSGYSFFDLEIPQELWWLLGISTTSLVGSPIILTDVEGSDLRDSATKAGWSDLWKGEKKNNQHYLDISRIQMFYFTLVVYFGYAFQVGILLYEAQTNPNPIPIESLPTVPSGMLTILGISHAGYLGKKAQKS